MYEWGICGMMLMIGSILGTIAILLWLWGCHVVIIGGGG
jgi:hypothetical protein